MRLIYEIPLISVGAVVAMFIPVILGGLIALLFSLPGTLFQNLMDRITR